MTTRLSFWRALRDVLASGSPAFVGVVVDHTRHSPGTRGAHVLLTPTGQQIGTVGGGIMEQQLLTRGAEALRVGRFKAEVRELFHRKELPADQPGDRSGLICAGRQTNAAFLVDPARDLEAVAQAVACLEADASGALTFAPSRGLRFVADTPPRLDVPALRVEPREGGSWALVEELLERRRAVIFGAGHCGLALSRQLDWLGYVTTVADVRPDVHTLAENTSARHVLLASDFAALASEVAHPALTCAVVMTANLPSDVRALLGALRLAERGEGFPFLGVMGAPAKLRAIRAKLGEAGFTDEALARITAPVGVPIGSSTPEEIAVSVAAQLIQLRPELFPASRPTPFQLSTRAATEPA